jgi:hypothetical protein
MAWINVFLLFYLMTFPILLQVNTQYLKGKNKKLNKILKTGRKIHPVAGVLLICLGAFHGFQMLGGQFIFHTGSLLLIAVIINGLLGFLYKKLHNRKFARAHRLIGFVIYTLFLLHYFNPWLLSQ